MAQTVLITLTTAGADTGPFDLYSDVDGYVAPFETGVSKSSLLAGYLSVVVPDGATVIRVKSESVLCTNYINLWLVTTTTTTSTSSTTTTTTTETPTTTTTTTSEDIVDVVLYARHDPGASTFPLLKFAYSVDGGSSWTAVGSSFSDTSCTQRAIINIQRNTSLSVKITEDGNVNNVWQSARDTSGCPAFSGAACTWPALTSNNTITYYFTVNGDNQGVC
jgi:hypothetical protein